MSNSVSDIESSTSGECEVTDLESGSSGDSSIYMYETSLTCDRLELRRCPNYVGDITASSPVYIDSDLSDQYAIRSAPQLPLREARRTSGRRPPFEEDPYSIFTDEEDVCRIRDTYNIPSSVALRVPLKTERASQARPNEIVVFEAFFAIGLRGKVPSLIAEVSRELNISPGQFTPTTWRVLTAIQVFGELFSVTLGVKEVLYAYRFLRHNVDKRRCIIHRRTVNFDPLVYDFQRSRIRAIPYEKEWTKKFLFMEVGHNPNFPVTWFHGDVKRKRCVEGRDGAIKCINYPEGYRLVEHLVSPFALGRSSIWGTMSPFDGSIGDTLDKFRRASQASLHVAQRPPSRDNQAASKSTLKRKATSSEGTSKVSKKTSHGSRGLASSSRSGVFVDADRSLTIAELNEKDFSHDLEGHIKLGPTASFDKVQASLLEAMSTCYYGKTQLLLAQDEIKRLTEANVEMKRV